MVQFDSLEKSLRIAFLTYFVYDFSRKMSLKDFIACLCLLLEILGGMCIAIVCFPVCEAINFEINLVFLIQPFFYMTKTSRQN